MWLMLSALKLVKRYVSRCSYKEVSPLSVFVVANRVLQVLVLGCLSFNIISDMEEKIKSLRKSLQMA